MSLLIAGFSRVLREEVPQEGQGRGVGLRLEVVPWHPTKIRAPRTSVAPPISFLGAARQTGDDLRMLF